MTENITKSFAELGLSDWIIKRCTTIGLKTPTPVQANCIPEILEGKHCIGAAKTGSGKTLAFALPIVQKLFEEPYGIFALVLTTTRELAYQISDQFTLIGKARNLKQCVIVGGMDMVEQGRQLEEQPHIVIATPGRLADHIEYFDAPQLDYLGDHKTFSFSKIKFLVIDEADKLLGGAFNEQLKIIFNHIPKERQNLLFSATVTDSLDKLKAIIQGEIFMYEAPTETATVEQLEQQYVLVPKDFKDGYLVQVIRTYRETNSEGSILVFTDSCRNCQVLSMMLNDVGFENIALHAMMSQKERLASLAKFKSCQIKMLIATNVASRGLDIPTVELVINHSVPDVPKEYIHRVGRTARAGRGGRSITLVAPYDVAKVLAIESLTNVKMTELKVDAKEVGIIYKQISLSKSHAYLNLDEQHFYEKQSINRRKKWILEGLDPDEEEKKLKKRKRKESKSLKKQSKKKKHLKSVS